jgi:AcrR family transcriptional regulator
LGAEDEDVPKAAGQPTRQRRQRGSINAEEIIHGAFEVARRVSLDQLSMPSLAEYLDVGVTSIYWYFRKKEELLNAMTDVAADKLVALVPPVRAEDTWQQALLEHFRSERQIHREDEVLSDLLLIRTSTYSREAARKIMALVEAVVEKLVDAGFTPENALLVYSAISVYTRGSIIQERQLRLAHTPTLDSAKQRRMMTDWSAMPVLDSLLDRYPLAGTSDEDFEFATGRLMCGFEVLLKEQENSTKPKDVARARKATPSKASATKSASTRPAAAKAARR